MTDLRQFGDRGTHSLDCARCEALLADAVDGVLSAEDQAFFDAHIAGCGPCEQGLAEARRGAAWLELLRTPAPEPPPALLEKILAQTATSPHMAPLAHATPAMAAGYANVLPFPRRAAASVRGNAFARILFEPRLAMTAAMAFLSIALTMDLMGVNPMDLRARDLTPSGMHRAFAQLDARAVQYYEGLRVVYELESRVHDFQEVQGNSQDVAPAQSQQAPSAAADQAQPSADSPVDQPDDSTQPENRNQEQDKAEPAPQPNGNAPAQHRAAPSDGMSRREGMQPAETHGSFVAYRGGSRHAAQATISAVELQDAVAAYEASEATESQADADASVGGSSSLVRIAPLTKQQNRAAERRAA